MKNIRLFFLAIVLVCCQYAAANRGGFYYENITVSVQVEPDNSFKVTEIFDIFFEQPRHGFYRYIPYDFTMTHDVSAETGAPQPDLRKFRYKCNIRNVSVGGGHYVVNGEHDKKQGYCVIRIGDSYREVEGLQSYTIQYTFEFPDDRLDFSDFFYYTVLGTDFEQPIRHFDFQVMFPKPLPDNFTQLLKVYSGPYGQRESTIDSLRIMKVMPNKIKGHADNVPPLHGVTLYAPLPADYFQGAHKVSNAGFNFFLIITAVLILLVIFMLFWVGKTPKVTKVIEFYPPEGIGSAEVGTIIDSTVNTIDVVSIIPELAGKGYIKIEDDKDDLLLTKLKDLPPDAPSYQKEMMTLLFSEASTIWMSTMERDPDQVEYIKNCIMNSIGYVLTELKWPVWLYPAIAVFGTILLSCESPVDEFEDRYFFSSVLLFGGPFALSAYLSELDSRYKYVRSKFRLFATALFRVALMLIGWAGFSILVLDYGAPLGPVELLPLYVICIILNELIGRFRVSTDYRLSIIGRLLGFKEFIQTAEEPQLMHLQDEDPQYYFKVLPYAMVFGLSNKWADLFKNIAVEAPDWYVSDSLGDGRFFMRDMNHSFCSVANKAITIVSHKESESGGGGGFGGGGFSGGGGGGGGGGSW
ncbi:MAG: DUF2207 family protein [Prevotella sp.]